MCCAITARSREEQNGDDGGVGVEPGLGAHNDYGSPERLFVANWLAEIGQINRAAPHHSSATVRASSEGSATLSPSVASVL